MTTQTGSSASEVSLLKLIKYTVFWIPIMVGIIFQILMYFFGFTRIYVVLKPPEYIYPFTTLELGWWLVVTLISAIFYLLAYADRIRPHRLIYPLYAYIVFLLIFVKPV
jgi:hypothetical protein